MKNDGPCKNCTNRYLGCHADCLDYVDWKTNFEERKNFINNARYKQRNLDEYEKTKLKRRRSKRS